MGENDIKANDIYECMYPLGSEQGHNRIGMWGIIIHENLFFYIFNEKFVKNIMEARL